MTNSESILQLMKTAAILEERLDGTRSEIKRLEADSAKAADVLIEIHRKLAVLEENVKDLKQFAEERGRRRWAITLAVVGCLLTLAANVGLFYLKLGK